VGSVFRVCLWLCTLKSHTIKQFLHSFSVKYKLLWNLFWKRNKTHMSSKCFNQAYNTNVLSRLPRKKLKKIYIKISIVKILSDWEKRRYLNVCCYAACFVLIGMFCIKFLYHIIYQLYKCYLWVSTTTLFLSNGNLANPLSVFHNFHT